MRLTIDKNVRVPMRDGVFLATDIYRIAGAGPQPVILIRTPYSKDVPVVVNLALDVLGAVASGYAVVVQDTRGRYRSEGSFDPFTHEGEDGAATIKWAAKQPWSDGKIAMSGLSYLGATQMLAAIGAPPALRAIAPTLTAANYYEGWAYQGGAFRLGFNLLWTVRSLALGETQSRQIQMRGDGSEFLRVVAAVDNIAELYLRLPLTDQPLLRELAPYYLEWLEHPDYDDYWRRLAPCERYDQVSAPALHVGGWHDIFREGTLQNFEGMSRHAATPAAREGQRLVMGPWAHGANQGAFPDRLYGFMAGADAADQTGMQLRWFDRWLKGRQDVREPRVNVFVMGADSWRDFESWPPPGVGAQRFYLHQGGTLHPARPEDELPDAYRYDPADPVPTLGGANYLPGFMVGANAGPRDQRPVEARNDVVAYTGPVLESELQVMGVVRLTLYASSSAFDTDFTGKLVDVHTDGRAELVVDAIIRARYRDSLSMPELLVPGRVYCFQMALGSTAFVFPAGHRIRLEVSSSNFPQFDRNTNTGRLIAHDGAADMKIAHNQIYHNREHPSHLELPVLGAR